MNELNSAIESSGLWKTTETAIGSCVDGDRASLRSLSSWRSIGADNVSGGPVLV